jgi:hypothetical protein
MTVTTDRLSLAINMGVLQRFWNNNLANVLA